MSKLARNVVANNLYYFNKKAQIFELTYDQITRASKFIIRANEPDKTLGNKQGKTLLTAIADKIKVSKNGEIFIDHDWISSITDCKPEQNTNILGQLADILDFKYYRSVIFEGKKRHYGLIVKFTHDGEKRLTNPELFYDVKLPKKDQKETVGRPKKIGHHLEKNRSSYIDKKEILREVEEIAYGYISSTKEKNKIKEESVEPIILAKSSLTELASELVFYQSTDKISIQKLPPNQLQEEGAWNSECRSLSVPYGAAPCLSKNSSELTLTGEQEENHYSKHKVSDRRSNNQTTSLALVVATMTDLPIAANQNEEDTSLTQGQQEEEIHSTAIVTQITRANEEVVATMDKPIRLQQEIFKSFNPKIYEEIMENCTFTELEPNKLGIRLQAEFKLSEEDKGKLRTCIRMVYGSDVKMVSTAVAKREVSANEIKQEEQQPRPSANSISEWDRFKVKIAEYFPQEQYNHVMNTWLDHLRYSHSSQDKIVVVGRSFYVDEIYQRFVSAIEKAVVQTKKSIEIQYECNAQKPIEFDFNKLSQRG